TATGETGTFQNPFDLVLFAYVDLSVAAQTHRFIAIDATATVSDTGDPLPALGRTWTWSATLTASDLPDDVALGVLPVPAIGVDLSTVTALLSASSVNVTVIDT